MIWLALFGFLLFSVWMLFIGIQEMKTFFEFIHKFVMKKGK